MKGRMALVLGAGLTVGVCAGAVAGLDAARNVDAVYTTPRPVRYAALPPMPSSSPWDWNEMPVAANPPPGLPEQAGAAERAFFEEGAVSAMVDEPVVRVHRPRRVVVVEDEALPAADLAPEPEPEPPEPAPTI